MVPPEFHSSDKREVDLRGLEPLTSSMPWMRSSSCATGPCMCSELCTHSTRYRAYRQALKAWSDLPLPACSDLLLTGEFSQLFQPCTNRLLSVEFWLTTPAHCILFLYYTITLCDLQCIMTSTGGDEGARTPDLDSAIVALFQLSYIPVTR